MRLEARGPMDLLKSLVSLLKPVFRWVLCWYGKATVNRPDAGSIPAAGAFMRKGKPIGDGTPFEAERA